MLLLLLWFRRLLLLPCQVLGWRNKGGCIFRQSSMATGGEESQLLQDPPEKDSERGLGCQD